MSIFQGTASISRNVIRHNCFQWVKWTLIATFFSTAAYSSATTPPGLFQPPQISVHSVHYQKAQKEISRSQAAAAAKSRYGGKVLNIKKGRGHYRVKLLLPSGHVKQVMVNSRTGKTHR